MTRQNRVEGPGPGGEQLSRAKVRKNQCTHRAGF